MWSRLALRSVRPGRCLTRPSFLAQSYATRVVSFNYTLTNTKGEKIDSSEGREPLTFLEGSGHIIPGLEQEVCAFEFTSKIFDCCLSFTGLRVILTCSKPFRG